MTVEREREKKGGGGEREIERERESNRGRFRFAVRFSTHFKCKKFEYGSFDRIGNSGMHAARVNLKNPLQLTSSR